MNWLKRNPFFALTLSVCTGAMAIQAIFLREFWQQQRRAAVTLEQRQQELAWLVRQSPAPSETNISAIEADVVAAERNLANLRAALQGNSRGLADAPKRPIDAYFGLATFVKRMRELAARQQIILRPDEYFGFATYTNEGPAVDHLVAVHRQRTLVEHLVVSLFEARPRALLTVKREYPLTEAQRVAQRATPDSEAVRAERYSGQAGDFFAADSRLRLRVADLVESEVFRLEFTGQTKTLRTFLNTLSAYRLPLVVRSVEVEPLPAEVGGVTKVALGAAVPLVVQTFSKFTVVVEFVEVLPDLPAPSP
ncbi:MAG: Amuc_1100 family pilus-like protein [Candidatus Didemnitutus sp.]|nr:Amuc_1100 family pilus-like protein [Candidatus Didemnitutus sp.]